MCVPCPPPQTRQPKCQNLNSPNRNMRMHVFGTCPQLGEVWLWTLRVAFASPAEYTFWGRRWAAYITAMATSRVRVRDLLSTQRKLWVPSESVRMSREPIGRTVSPFDIQVALPSPVWVGRSEWRQKEIFNLSRPCLPQPRGQRIGCREMS